MKTFNQLPKKNLRILALDRKFKITQNDIIKMLIKCQKRTYRFWQLIESLIKLLIKWQLFRRLTEKFDQLIRSSEIRSSDRFPLGFIKVVYLKFLDIFRQSPPSPPYLNPNRKFDSKLNPWFLHLFLALNRYPKSIS